MSEGGTAVKLRASRQGKHQWKDGSAQSGRAGQTMRWSIAYAPSDVPSVSMGILVEHGLHGATAAGPVAKAVAEV